MRIRIIYYLWKMGFFKRKLDLFLPTFYQASGWLLSLYVTILQMRKPRLKEVK